MKFPPATDIRKMRKSLDITQSELSARSGISQSTITKIERGRISASYETVVKLFETLEEMRIKGCADLTAADVSSKTVVTIQSDSKVHEASDLMRRTGYSQLPVLMGNAPVGSISERSIFRLLGRGTTMEELSNMNVAEVMDESFPVVADTTSISSVTSLMADNNAILVSTKGQITGMITNADLLKLI
jgi:predicted transcriptional regulator